MEYKFDGYDAILNEDDQLIYDGLDSRSADIIIRQMESLDLCEAKIAELENEIDALKRECNLLYASLSQPGKYRLPPKEGEDAAPWVGKTCACGQSAEWPSRAEGEYYCQDCWEKNQ